MLGISLLEGSGSVQFIIFSFMVMGILIALFITIAK